MVDLATVLGGNLGNGKFWTDAWSLVEGCTPVSPGCKNCWLASMYKRNLPNLSADVAGEYTTPTNEKVYRFHGNVICHFDRLEKPLRGSKQRIYAIWSDLFHTSVSDHFISKAFDTMNRARRHHFIIITKRPARAVEYLGSWPSWSPMPNVTILVTMEDQQRANERAPHAFRIGAMGWRIGALCEPLLGPVDLEMFCSGCGHLTDAECPGSSGFCHMRPRYKWIITGGESGPGARPCHPDWVRSLRDQATAAQVPFMFKQWGGWAPTASANYALPGGGNRHGNGTGIAMLRDGRHVLRDLGPSKRIQVIDPQANEDLQRQMDKNEVDPRNPDQYEWLGYQWMHQVDKSKSGRSLDGKEYLELPAN